LKNNTKNDILALSGFDQAAWSFISSIYKDGWNFLKADSHNRTYISSKFTLKIINKKPNRKVKSSIKGKQVEIVEIPSSILPRLSKEILEIFQFFQKKIRILKKTLTIRIVIYMYKPHFLTLRIF